MIGLDTNVLARYIVRDDVRQTAAATRLIETACTSNDPGHVALIVLCELVWVLGRGYGYARLAIAGVIRLILAADDLRVEHSELAWQALNLYEHGKADFADYVIGLGNREQSVVTTYTFDRHASDRNLFKMVAG